MNTAQLRAFLDNAFPQVKDDFEILELGSMTATIGMAITDRNLRPGGTVSGPSMFSLADVSFYLALMAMIGPKSLAVTTNCAIDFLRKPAAKTDIFAVATIHKLGRVLAVGQVLLYSKGQEAPIAQANLTYSIPPRG